MRFVFFICLSFCLSFYFLTPSILEANPAAKKKTASTKVAPKNDKTKQVTKKPLTKKTENSKVETSNPKSTKNANSPANLIGQYKDWLVQDYEDQGKKNAYMISAPIKMTGDYDKRGPAYLLISRQGDAKTGKDIVSFVAGYAYKDKTIVEVIFQNKKKYDLFTQGDRAWAPDDKTDKALVDDMKRGSKIQIKGISSKGTSTLDEISLAGFMAAYKMYLEKSKN